MFAKDLISHATCLEHKLTTLSDIIIQDI